MAGEKRTSVNFSVVKDGLTNQLVVSRSEDLSGSNVISIIQTITTATNQAITITGLASVDLIAIKNNDATNYVEIAIDSAITQIISKLTAGRGCFLPAATGVTYYARANTASCDIQVVAVEP